MGGTDIVAASGSDGDLYAQVAPALGRFASALVGPDDAPDIVSAAVTRALGSPAWSTVSNRQAYLYRAVVNEAARLRRRAVLRRDREARASARDRCDLPDLRPEVAAAVDRLSVRQRAVILLTYWADLEPATIARLLEISEGSVRRHLARARARLREVLDA